MDANRIDWNLLRSNAFDVMKRAYAPYSRYPVGAAGWTDRGVVVGCNVENVSIPTL
jgi:cytidine deaminase